MVCLWVWELGTQEQPERSLSCALEWAPFSLMYLGIHITYTYLVTRAPKQEGL